MILLFFENSTEDEGKLGHSVIKPFLEANLITLIHYPYSSTDDQNVRHIQTSAFTFVLNVFGQYSKWMGFFDVDEFFLPSKDLLQGHGHEDLFDILERFDNSSIAYRSKNPSRSLSFNTWDMKCNGSSYGRNLSVSTHCTTSGFSFIQHNITNGVRYPCVRFDEAGHGKTFVKSQYFSTLASPHESPEAVVGTSEHGGRFCHYNDFRYSNMLGKPRNNPKETTAMVDFAKTLLTTKIGIDF